MRVKSAAIARKTAAVLAVWVAVLGSVTAVIWLFETGLPPFCSGYLPVGNCPPKFGYTFTILVNYTGPWQATYYGYRSLGPPSSNYGVGNYTGGTFTGTVSQSENVTLTGPSTSGLTMCVQAEKLDSSSSTLTLGLDNRNTTTTLPDVPISLCTGVAP